MTRPRRRREEVEAELKEQRPDPIVEALLKGPVAPEVIPEVIVPEAPPAFDKPPAFTPQAAFDAPKVFTPTAKFSASFDRERISFDSGPRLRFGSGRGTRRLIRRTIIVRQAPAPGRETVWVEGYKFAEAFDNSNVSILRRLRDGWQQGHDVDFDEAAASAFGQYVLYGDVAPGVWGVGLDKEDDSLIGYNTPYDLGSGKEYAEVFEEEGLWQRCMQRFAELREHLMDHLELLDGKPFWRVGVTDEVAHWAAVPRDDLNLANVVATAFASEADRRVTGPLAALVDCIAWNRPDWIDAKGGVELTLWFTKLRTGITELARPKDNFLIRDPWPSPRTGTGRLGRPKYLMRGSYGVAEVTYVSAVGKMADRAPLGVPGWRQCILSRHEEPIHHCGVDCQHAPDNPCPQEGQRLSACQCGHPDCPECSAQMGS